MKKKIKAWGVYSKGSTHGIVWCSNSTFVMPLAVFADKKEAVTRARDYNNGRRVYKVLPCTITYTLPNQ